MLDLSTFIPSAAEPVIAVMETEDILEQAGRSSIRIPIRVWGYWSTDPITLYIRRQITSWRASDRAANGDYPYEWQAQVSHSSGGRDTKQVESDLEAAAYFAQAILRAVEIGRNLVENQDELEAAYQAHCAALEAEAKAIAEAKQLKIDADVPLGKQGALELVKGLRNHAEFRSGDHLITTYERGADGCLTTMARATKLNFLTWYWLGRRISEEKMIEELAKLSHRTHYAVQGA